jgi:hypothetical protein
MSTTYLVSYDLSKPERNYDDLFKVLRSFSGYAKALKSVWFVCSDLSTAGVRDKIQKVLDSNDHLLVTNVKHGDSAWYGLEPDVSNWLQDNYKAA